MKSSSRDNVEGKTHQAKGNVKETIGRIVGNPALEAEGEDEKMEGKIQQKLGQGKKLIGK